MSAELAECDDRWHVRQGENIELYGVQEQEQIIEILIDESAATSHPHQADSYVLGRLPFHAPRQVDNHISILGFNNMPLPESLLEALVDHAESFPDDILVRGTQEQDLIFEATLGHLRGHEAQP